jgi:putative spermidine/putrescine transport system substrate-binding protein
MLIAAMITAGGLFVVPASAEDLVVISYGGTFEQGWRKAVINRFEEKYPKDKIHIATGLTMEVAAKMRAQKDNVEIDVVMMDLPGTIQCEAEGLFEPLTEEKVPNLRNLLPLFKKRAKEHPYVHFFWDGETLAYNTEKIKPPPTSWKVLFDPKYSGHIAFPDISTSHGVWMLNMAARIHGGNERNIDPGFEAIKKIRPHIGVFWTQHGQLQQLFAQGEVWLSLWCTNRLAPVKKEGVPVDWTIPEEGVYMVSSIIGIAKGTKHSDLASRYINFVLDAQTQALMTKYTYLAPVVKDAKVDPSMIKERMIPRPEELGKLLDLDWDTVNKERPKWTERWRREIAIQ